MFSTAKPARLANRIPAILALLTLALAAIAAIPTSLLGGTSAVAMLGIGAGLGLLAVLGGYVCAGLAFRGPDRYAVKLIVGGFLIRVVLLLGSLFVLVRTTGLDPGRFVLWLVLFYLVLVMVEAWILSRDAARHPQEGTAR